MFEFVGRLFDTTGFSPPNTGAWPPALVSLHVGSNLFLWLAYLSIPLILIYFTRRRRDLPYLRFFALGALFLLAAGFGHLIDALTFEHPIYRFAAMWKVWTAIAAWATVLALVGMLPRALAAVAPAHAGPVGVGVGDTTLHQLAATPANERARDYIVAILAAVLALLVRGAIEPIVEADHFYVLSLLAVVFVSWHGGFGPAMVTLLISMFGMIYFFLKPGGTFYVEGLSSQLATAVFYFCGVCCAALGEAQRASRRGARSALAVALERKAELEVEVARRAAAEDSARESEGRFRSMADSAPALIWLSDLDRRRTYFNRTWLEFTGRSVEEEMGDGWLADVHPDDRELYLTAYTNAFDARKPFEVEYRLRRWDGAHRWVLARGTPRFTSTGGFAGFVGLCLDVTDRKRAEEDLGHSERRFRTLTEAIPQMVWNAGANGEVAYFNRRWQEYTGIPLEAAAGRGWLAAVHPDDVERVYAAWQLTALNAPGGTDRFSQEFRLRRAGDGAYRWMLAVAVPLAGPDGAIDQWIGAIADIDDQKQAAANLERTVRERTAELQRVNGLLVEEIEERKRVEQQVRAVAADLARSNDELEQFAYVASHDLQEPLRKIQAFGDRLVLRVRDHLPEAGKEYVDRMLTSAGRMRRLIDDLLSFSRVTSQARPFSRVDLGKLAREVANDLSERIDDTGGEVRVGELPTVDADPSQMRQLFQNLIANALKFHRPGVPPVVEVSGEVASGSPNADGAAGMTCRIVVRDNGIGFDEKYLDRIFQMFQRLHGRGEYEGTGVGLAICRKIAERHGGAITATSRVGEGAAFAVTIPIRQAYPADEPVHNPGG